MPERSDEQVLRPRIERNAGPGTEDNADRHGAEDSIGAPRQHPEHAVRGGHRAPGIRSLADDKDSVRGSVEDHTRDSRGAEPSGRDDLAAALAEDGQHVHLFPTYSENAVVRRIRYHERSG